MIPSICEIALPMLSSSQKKCETYWPESADEEFVPCPGSPLIIEYKSILPFPEFVIREMVVTHVCFQYQALSNDITIVHRRRNQILLR